MVEWFYKFNIHLSNNFSFHPLRTVAFKLEQPQHASRTRKKERRIDQEGNPSKNNNNNNNACQVVSCQVGARYLPFPYPCPCHALSSALPMPCRAKRCRATRTRFKGCQLPIEAVKYAKQFDSQRDCVGVSVFVCV